MRPVKVRYVGGPTEADERPTPKADVNGIPLPGDYVAQVRENLGDPSDYTKEPQLSEVREVTQDIRDGNGNVVPYTSRFTRVDN